MRPDVSLSRRCTTNILFEDKYLIVVEKSAGLLSIGTAKERSKTAYSILSDYVKKQHPGNKIFVVHRLDRDTSGLMLFAKNQDIQSLMQTNWRFAVNQRKYTGVLEGVPQTGDGSGQGTVTSYLWESKALIVYASPNPEDGIKAVTHYKILKSSEHYSLAEFKLDTGRKNQIRVQMNSIGYPIAGDLKYGGHVSPIKRMALHASVLAFTHPVSGEQMLFESETPKEFLRLLELDKKPQ
jgi:23S rRNA pseudouridine1911/1915/1917 synthase